MPVQFLDLRPIRGEFTSGVGSEPGKGVIVTTARDGSATNKGTLTFINPSGGAPFSMPNVTLVKSTYFNEGNKRLMRHLIADQRIEWKGKYVSGKWNFRNADGTLVQNNQQTLTQLLQQIFQALGVTNIDLSGAAQNSQYYKVDWGDGADAAEELDKLLELSRMTVGPSPSGNWIVVPRSQGSLTPTGAHSNGERSFPQSRPSRIDVVFGPTLWQMKWSLYPIAFDTNDLEWKYIDDPALNYRPSNGWRYLHPESMAGQTNQINLWAAERFVWRFYQMYALAQGGLTLPGTTEVLNDIAQVTPVEERLPYAGKNFASIFNLGIKPFIQGVFASQGLIRLNTPRKTVYQGPFELQRDAGIVAFEDAVYKCSEGGTAANPVDAELYLTVAHQAKSNNGSTYRHTVSVNGGGNGPPVTIHREDVQRVIIGLYDSEDPRQMTGTQDNEGELNTIAQQAAQQYLAETQQDAKDIVYPGLVPAFPSGIIRQVTWTWGIETGATTRASSFHKHQIVGDC